MSRGRTAVVVGLVASAVYGGGAAIAWTVSDRALAIYLIAAALVGLVGIHLVHTIARRRMGRQ